MFHVVGAQLGGLMVIDKAEFRLGHMSLTSVCGLYTSTGSTG